MGHLYNEPGGIGGFPVNPVLSNNINNTLGRHIHQIGLPGEVEGDKTFV